MTPVPEKCKFDLLGNKHVMSWIILINRKSDLSNPFLFSKFFFVGIYRLAVFALLSHEALDQNFIDLHFLSSDLY